MHALLARQLRRHLQLDPGQVDARLAPLIAAVDAAYAEADSDRKLLEHSLNLAAVEMHERYIRLQRDAEVLRQMQAARDTFFQMSSDLLCITDLGGVIREANQTWTQVFGHSPAALVGVSLASLLHPDDADRLPHWNAPHPAPSESTTGEVRVRTGAGNYRHVVWSSTCDAVSATVFVSGRDITDLKVRDSLMTQAQKLQAVGQLAAGVAHEINTPIQYLGDNVEFVRQSFAELKPWLTALAGDPAHSAQLALTLVEVPRALDDTLDGVARVAELVRALKHFAHPDSKEKAPLDLNQAITCTLTVARNELKDVADVELDLGVLPRIACHGGALNQVFLNLLVNAAHAISDAGAGTRGAIRVVSRCEGREVVVRVTDSGPGIPEHIRHRIFEPFFTTKQVGRGSGQGLALARAIVDEHKGKMGFDSVPGHGTTFWIRLPVDVEGAP